MRRITMAAAALLVLAGGCTAPPEGPAAAKEKSAMFDLQAHRGGRGLRPENTLAAFRHALALGVTTLELDCGVTRDGVVVVSHDTRLNPDITRGPDGRFLQGPGPAIAELSFAELGRYDVGRIDPASAYRQAFPEQQAVDGERIPRLSDLFALVAASGNGSVRFNIETKIEPTDPEGTVPPDHFVLALLSAIRGAELEPRVTIQSFDWRTLVLLRKLAPRIALVALTDQQPGEDTMEVGKPGASAWLGGLDVDDHGGSVPKTVAALGATTWSPHARDLTPESIAEARALGLSIVPWTVNEPKDMEAVLAAGVDGLITDYPDRLRALLESKGMAVAAPTPVP
ncbi:MAG TPA: glycerophosphodiester phosphodiesterase [Steroidobacteraceae bacterium]|jgi:glycerophosphoryl diester phosphodiesterase|nr:glycerophosphodiester phosphodiesterase [Steroidobacteraceae bacterium]